MFFKEKREICLPFYCGHITVFIAKFVNVIIIIWVRKAAKKCLCGPTTKRGGGRKKSGSGRGIKEEED